MAARRAAAGPGRAAEIVTLGGGGGVTKFRIWARTCPTKMEISMDHGNLPRLS